MWRKHNAPNQQRKKNTHTTESLEAELEAAEGRDRRTIGKRMINDSRADQVQETFHVPHGFKQSQKRGAAESNTDH